jgi:TolC family type I secretion outer membrane protein
MRFRVLPFFVGTAVLCSSATAQFNPSNPSDPFDTAPLTPPRPLLQENEWGSDREKAGAENFDTPCQMPRFDGSPNAPLSILEAVDLALCNNPQTRELWASARVQAAQLGVAQSAYLPTVDGKLSVARLAGSSVSGEQNNASLTLSWLLFDFGTRAANRENARQLLVAATATLDATVQAVFLNALQSYYNAQAARAALAAALESEKASRESLAAAEVRYQVGSGTPADRLQAQTAWSQATLNRIKAEGEQRNLLGVLANGLGLDANQPLVLADIGAVTPDAFFERDIAALIEEARQRRPDLKAAEAQANAAQSGVDAARAAGLPTLSLGAGPSWQENAGFSSHSRSLGLTLTVPIFSGYNTTYKIRAAEAQQQVKSAQRERIRLQVALDVWKAYQSLSTATQSLKTTADLLASAEQSERVALGRYKAGVGTILDVLNAQSALAAARLQRIQARLDWQVYRATLAQAIGALDSRLLPAASPERLP